MIAFDRPKNLNGAELRLELSKANIKISNEPDAIMIKSDGKLYLDILDSDRAKAEEVIIKHNGTIEAAEPTIQDKLATVGVKIDDLKAALGL